MDQSVSLFTKDTRHCDAVYQSVSPWVVYVYWEKTLNQSVSPDLIRKDGHYIWYHGPDCISFVAHTDTWTRVVYLEKKTDAID